MQKSDNKYHHGELRQSLLETAITLINEQGIESLSLRKLAENIGVSRTALYHHFKNKNELLCAIAEQSFLAMMETNQSLLQSKQASRQSFKDYTQNYFDYALNNQDLYDLMFGNQIWKHNNQTDALKQTAHDCFTQHVKLIEHWQQQGLLNNKLPSLRVAQVSWGTLHGLAKLIIDGVYADRKNLTQLNDTIFGLFVTQ